MYVETTLALFVRTAVLLLHVIAQISVEAQLQLGQGDHRFLAIHRKQTSN